MTTVEVFRKNPSWFRALNKAWKLTYPLTRITLKRDALIDAARKVTGLTDLGEDFNPEPLDLLLDAIEKEAELHPVGRFITRQRFISLLSMRLRAEYFFKKYPGILEQQLYPAWFIVGLQRTGTTKLQRLLATDPFHRMLYSWEAINPVPLSLDYHPEKNFQKDQKKRISVARTSAKALALMSPAFNAIHPVSIFEPEEDVLLLDVSFMSTTPEAMMHVPSYSSWLEKTDQSEAYEYAVKLLKLLQWQRPARRWILKSPHHLEFTRTISRYFPDVRFIWPHRNIYESIPSFLSMVSYTHMIFSNHVDPDRIANHWVRKTGYMLDQALEFRKEHPGYFIDLNYHEFVKDALKGLELIYSMNGGIPPDQAERFRKHEVDNPQRKFGKHQYSLEDFHLTQNDIDQHTFNYQNFLKDVRQQTKEI